MVGALASAVSAGSTTVSSRLAEFAHDMRWRVSRTAHADFVLDALEQALHDRRPTKGGLIHHSDRQDLPTAVQREAARAFLNWVGCAAGGARTESAEAAVRGLSAMSGPGTTPVLGRAERLQPADAALASCLAS